MDIPQIISRRDATVGEMGQKYLAAGRDVALRQWQEAAGDWTESSCREYETVGYLISGSLQLDLGGEVATLEPGDSWLVPKRAAHRYRVREPIVVVEATTPPARFNQRDE